MQFYFCVLQNFLSLLVVNVFSLSRVFEINFFRISVERTVRFQFVPFLPLSNIRGHEQIVTLLF